MTEGNSGHGDQDHAMTAQECAGGTPLSDRLTASRECDAEIAVDVLGFVYEKRARDRQEWFYAPDGKRKYAKYFGGTQPALPRFTTSLDAAASLYLDIPARIPSDPLECCREALKQRGL